MIKPATILLLLALISADGSAQGVEKVARPSFGAYLGGAWPTVSAPQGPNHFGLSLGLIRDPGFISGLDFSVSGVGAASREIALLNVNAYTFGASVHWFPLRPLYAVGVLAWKRSRYYLGGSFSNDDRRIGSFDDLSIGLGAGVRINDLWVVEFRYLPGLRKHEVGGSEVSNSISQLRIGILTGDVRGER